MPDSTRTPWPRPRGSWSASQTGTSAKKELLQKPISRQLEHVIQERVTVQAGKDDRNYVEVSAEDMEGVTAQVVTPIICEGDAIGAVVIMSREPRAKFSEGELRLAATAAGFLGRQMES